MPVTSVISNNILVIAWYFLRKFFLTVQLFPLCIKTRKNVEIGFKFKVNHNIIIKLFSECNVNYAGIAHTCLSCEDIARQSRAMVPRWRLFGDFWVLFREPRTAHFRPTCVRCMTKLTITLTFLVGVWSIVMSVFVCPYVFPLAYLKKNTSQLHKIFFQSSD